MNLYVSSSENSVSSKKIAKNGKKVSDSNNESDVSISKLSSTLCVYKNQKDKLEIVRAGKRSKKFSSKSKSRGSSGGKLQKLRQPSFDSNDMISSISLENEAQVYEKNP
jgi:hypothetical protein